METYQAEYVLTKEELIRAQKYHYQANLRPSIALLLNVFIALLAVMSLFLLFDGASSTATVSAVIFIGYAFYWFLLRRKVTSWWLTRNFNKSPAANVLVRYEITNEELKIESEGLAKSEVKWVAFEKIVESSEGFLIYSLKTVFHWLPFSAFKDTEGINKFRAFASASGVEYKVSP